MNNFKIWFHQPTTMAGISVELGLLSSVFSGAVTWQHAAGPMLSALITILVPDNTVKILKQSQSNGDALKSASQNNPTT